MRKGAFIVKLVDVKIGSGQFISDSLTFFFYKEAKNMLKKRPGMLNTLDCIKPS